MQDPIIWVLIGISLILIDLIIFPNVGILFCGFSGITVAITVFINSETLDSSPALQIFLFIFYSFIWSMLLWYPLRIFLGYSAEDEHKMIIGSVAVLQTDISKEMMGILHLSGKEIKCIVDPDSNITPITAKSHVKVVNIVDNVYWVRSAKEESGDIQIPKTLDKDTLNRLTG